MLANTQSQKMLDALRNDIIYMPRDALSSAIRFYALDAQVNEFLKAVMAPEFSARPVKDQGDILRQYAGLFDDAVAAARAAEAAVGRVARLRPGRGNAGRAA